jgi:type II secretory pathway pseudopilin PulG
MSKNPNRRGFSLLEVGLAIGVTALTVAGMLHVQTDSSDAIRANAAADQLVQIQQAAQIYVNENFNTLYVPETSGTTNTLQVSDLVNAGLLPQGFDNRNIYGQTLEILLTRGTQTINGTQVPVENGLVITKDGTKLDDKTLGRMMSRIGAGGGAYLNNPPPGVTANTVLGFGGGWSVSASQYPDLLQGHAVATLNFGANSTQFGDQLYRNYLGPVELNTLHTLIDANGNNIDNLGALRFTPSIASSASNCQEPASGQTEENLMAASGNPCFVYDGSTDWLTVNGNGVSNGLLVGQSPGNNSAISGQSLGMTPNGIQFYNGAAGSATSPNANLLGALSMNLASGPTIYSTANGLTQGGVNIDTAGGNLSTAQTSGYGNTITGWGTVNGGNVVANQGGVYVTNGNSSTTSQFSGDFANLAAKLAYKPNNGGTLDIYNAGQAPVVQTGDDGSANGQLIINNSSGKNAIHGAVNSDGGGVVTVYNDLEKSIAALQETVNHGGTLALQNSSTNTVASLGDDGSGRGMLELNNQLAVHLATGGENGNGGGYLETYNQNANAANLISNDASGNGQITLYDSTTNPSVQMGVNTGGYLDIYNATHNDVATLGATSTGNGDLTLYNNTGTNPIARLGNLSGQNSGALELYNNRGGNGIYMDVDGDTYGSGRIFVNDSSGQYVVGIQGDQNQNGSITINDSSGGQRLTLGVNAGNDSGTFSLKDSGANGRVAIIVDGSDNGQLNISNSGNTQAVSAGVSSSAYQPTLHSGLLGQIINAFTGKTQVTGYIGVGTSTTGAPNAELYESGNNGYLYTSGGIDDPCFDSQGGNFVMQGGCTLETQGQNITTQLGSSNYYGNLLVGNVDVANGYNVTMENGDLVIKSGGISDPCFNDTSGAFNVKCAAAFSNGLSVNGATTLNGGVTVTNGALNTVNSGIDSKCFNDTSGTFYVSCNLSMTGTATVGTLEVTSGGIKIEQGNLAINNGGLTDKCMSDINDTLAISCSSTFNNGLSVTSGVLNATAGGIDSKCFNDTAGTFNFTCNDVSLPGNLTVNNVHVTNNETIDGNLSVGGGIASKCFNDETGAFSVSCEAYFSGHVNFQNGVDITGGDLVVDSGHIRDNCFDDRDGTFRLSCNLAINGTLSVSGQATVGSLEVQNGATIDNGDLAIKNGNLHVNGSMSDECYSDVGGGFSLSCPGVFGNGFTVSNGLTNFQGGLEVTGGSTTLDTGLTVNNAPIVSTAGIKDSCFDDTTGSFKVSCNLGVNGTGTFTGRIGVNGYGTTPDDVSFPIGWGGGVATYDLYAHGSIGVGGGGTPAIAMTQDADGNGLFYLNSSPSAGSKNLAIMGTNASTGNGGFLTLNNASGLAVATLASDSNSNGQLYLNNSGGGRVAEIVVDTSTLTAPAPFPSATGSNTIAANAGQIVTNGLVGVGSSLGSPDAYFYQSGSNGYAYVNGDMLATDNVVAEGSVGVQDSNGNLNAYFQENNGQGNLNVHGNGIFGGNLQANGGTFNSKCITDNGSLDLSCGTTVNGTLSVPNNGVTFGAGLSVGGGTTTDSLTVTQNAVVNGTAQVFGGVTGGYNGDTNVNTAESRASFFYTPAYFEVPSAASGQKDSGGNSYSGNTTIFGGTETTDKVTASTEFFTSGSVQAVSDGTKPAGGIVWGNSSIVATTATLGSSNFCATGTVCAEMNASTGEFDGSGLFSNGGNKGYCNANGFTFNGDGTPALCVQGSIKQIVTQ